MNKVENEMGYKLVICFNDWINNISGEITFHKVDNDKYEELMSLYHKKLIIRLIIKINQG